MTPTTHEPFRLGEQTNDGNFYIWEDGKIAPIASVRVEHEGDRIIAILNACMGLNPAAYQECVEALQSLAKFAHLYATSSEEARERPLFGQTLSQALHEALHEATQALAHAQEPR